MPVSVWKPVQVEAVRLQELHAGAVWYGGQLCSYRVQGVPACSKWVWESPAACTTGAAQRLYNNVRDQHEPGCLARFALGCAWLAVADKAKHSPDASQSQGVIEIHACHRQELLQTPAAYSIGVADPI